MSDWLSVRQRAARHDLFSHIVVLRGAGARPAMSIADLLTPAALTVFVQVVLIDIVLAGDNAVVIGLAAARLPPHQRRRAIVIGIAAATLLRIGLAAGATFLLRVPGLVLAGGLLLLWVAWRMAVDLHRHHRADSAAASTAAPGGFGAAVWQIVFADVSMSIDNVLAVAGAAREHPIVLALGLLLSVALMGLAAALIARVLERFRWLAWIGLAVIVYVAIDMIWRGAPSVAALVGQAIG
jgi:YjbE family integral membrane protein